MWNFLKNKSKLSHTCEDSGGNWSEKISVVNLAILDISRIYSDGPGEFDFTQGANTTNPFWDFVSGLLKDPSPEQEACHAPKPILLDTGEVKTKYIIVNCF